VLHFVRLLEMDGIWDLGLVLDLMEYEEYIMNFIEDRK
jgi:hypothetical protein